MTDPKADLLDYLRQAREAMLWKLEGLSEYDARRPLTPTGTNLLGLVKHLSSCEAAYFGEVFDRPFPDTRPWMGMDAEPNADMWATPDESRADIVGLYRDACAHADATITALPLDAVGNVPHWPEERRRITLHRTLVHMTAETQRHAGHADIVRELVDGAAGARPDRSNLAPGGPDWWSEYRATVEDAARRAGGV